MDVSVILSTYNGEKYIVALLDSLLNQSYKIDELLISDDCSNDRTVKIVLDYIRIHNLENSWQIKANKKNLGWKVNFRNLFLAANGKYIFPCDQDDIWESDKIESMISVMEKHEEIQVLATNYIAFSQDGDEKELNQKNNTLDDFSLIKISDFKKGFYITRPGCVFCVRRDMKYYIEVYFFDDCPHDAFFWRIACLTGELFVLNHVTIRYRRHNGTVTGNDKKPNFERKKYIVHYYNETMDMLKKISIDRNIEGENVYSEFLKMDKWAKLRMGIFFDKKRSNILKLLFYIDCYQDRFSYFKDVFYTFSGENK